MRDTPAPTCERCGAFSEGLAALAQRQLCPPCVTRAAEGARYWSSGYLTGIGCLLNPGVAALLLALNHRRLGDEKQARSWALGSGLVIAFYVAVMTLDLPIPSSVLLPAAIGGGVAIGRSWAQPWQELLARGARRANPWLPPLLTVVAVVAVVFVTVLLGGGGE